jgi:hypothetical protein
MGYPVGTKVEIVFLNAVGDLAIALSDSMFHNRYLTAVGTVVAELTTANDESAYILDVDGKPTIAMANDIECFVEAPFETRDGDKGAGLAEWLTVS